MDPVVNTEQRRTPPVDASERRVSVFISSTSLDMNAERVVLVKQNFPRLRAEAKPSWLAIDGALARARRRAFSSNR